MACFILWVKGYDISVITTKETKNFSSKMNLSHTIFFYKLMEANGSLVDPHIVTVVPTLWILDDAETKVEILNQNSCEKNINYPENKYKDLLNFDLTNFQCLSRTNGKDIYLEFIHSPYSNKYINIYVARCKNTTENNNSCYSDEVINEQIQKSNFFLSFYSETTGLDHYNKDPISPSYLSKQIGVAVDFTNVNFYEFRQIIYETDEGFLFPKTQTKTAFSLDSATFRTILYKAGKEFYIPNTLSVFQFSMNQEYADKYQRSYQSIQELIANIGGVSNLVFIVIKFTSQFLTDGFIYYKLSDSLIVFHNQTTLNSKVFIKSFTDKVFPVKIAKKEESVHNSMFPFKGSSNVNKYKKVNISYIDTIIYRFMKNSQKGKIMESYARLVQKNLNVITLLKLCLYYHKIKDKKSKEDSEYNTIILLSQEAKNNSSMLKELNIKLDT